MMAGSNVPDGSAHVTVNVNAGDQKQADFKAGSIYNYNQTDAKGSEPSVVVDIGDGLQIFVPKSLTVSVSDANRTYPALVTIPVRDANGTLYDLETLLEEKHPNSAARIPQSVTVDSDFSARRSSFYTQVLQDQKELFASGKYPNAKAVLESLAAPGISYGRADAIKAAAGRVGLEIIDPQPGARWYSIAVDANSKFGPSHRVAITDSMYSMGLYKTVMTLISNNPGEVVGLDILMAPVYGLIENIKNHPSVNGEWWAMNRRGIPTFLLYSAAAMATWGTCLYVQGLCANNMRQNNYSDTGVRFATAAAAFGITVTTKMVYKFGPSAETISSGAAKVRDCAYSAATMLKTCGMKLWNCRGNNNPPAPGGEPLLVMPGGRAP